MVFFKHKYPSLLEKMVLASEPPLSMSFLHDTHISTSRWLLHENLSQNISYLLPRLLVREILKQLFLLSSITWQYNISLLLCVIQNHFIILLFFFIDTRWFTVCFVQLKLHFSFSVVIYSCLIFTWNRVHRCINFASIKIIKSEYMYIYNKMYY